MTRTRASSSLMLLLPLLALAAALLVAVPAFSFLPQLTSSQPDHWSQTAFPVQWNLNPSTQFDTGGGTGQNLQTVATHEIGHFFGLDHSAVVRAVMFPFAPDILTTLSYDDVAGISSLYPQGTPDVATGSISGKVRLSGSSVFGAHVFANSTTSALPFANVRKTPIGTLTLTDGSYTIRGVPPDSYLVVAEPLDLPVTDSDVSWASEFNQAKVQTNFTTRWH